MTQMTQMILLIVSRCLGLSMISKYDPFELGLWTKI